jgi:LuxR family maltose regulon positive regulatory protein
MSAYISISWTYLRQTVLGSGLVKLLQRLARHECTRNHIEQILAAFTAEAAASGRTILPPDRTAPSASMVEPLTSRELEVLELLAQRFSAKEIALRLIITERTVNRHIANIYQKLAVNKRREAVAAARALGMLPTQ